jgi:hypothetical protein
MTECSRRNSREFDFQTGRGYVMAIDPGMSHLGAAMAFAKQWKIQSVIFFARYDITQLRHRRVEREQCCLHHTKMPRDRVAHFIQEYANEFLMTNVVLVEQQPPKGLVAVEQLLMREFEDRAQLVSPTAMHKYLGIEHMRKNREARKVFTANHAQKHLDDLQRSQLRQYGRCHDIADAICMIEFWLAKMYKTMMVPRLIQQKKSWNTVAKEIDNLSLDEEDEDEEENDFCEKEEEMVEFEIRAEPSQPRVSPYFPSSKTQMSSSTSSSVSLPSNAIVVDESFSRSLLDFADGTYKTILSTKASLFPLMVVHSRTNAVVVTVINKDGTTIHQLIMPSIDGQQPDLLYAIQAPAAIAFLSSLRMGGTILFKPSSSSQTQKPKRGGKTTEQFLTIDVIAKDGSLTRSVSVPTLPKYDGSFPNISVPSSDSNIDGRKCVSTVFTNETELWTKMMALSSWQLFQDTTPSTMFEDGSSRDGSVQSHTIDKTTLLPFVNILFYGAPVLARLQEGNVAQLIWSLPDGSFAGLYCTPDIR